MDEHVPPAPGTTITPEGRVDSTAKPASAVATSLRKLSWPQRFALTAVLVLAVAVGTVLLVNRPKTADVTEPDIRAATYAYQQYVEFLRNDNIDAAYELTTPEYQAENPKDMFVLTQQARKDQGYLKGDYLITGTRTQGEKVLITARFNNDKNESAETATTLTLQGNRWLVAPAR